MDSLFALLLFLTPLLIILVFSLNKEVQFLKERIQDMRKQINELNSRVDDDE